MIGHRAVASPARSNRVAGIEMADAICRRIRASISLGSLPPGTRLPEETIAHAFSTTRFFVRAALGRLAWEGLVELQRNRGAFVAVPTVKEAHDVFEARRAIERVTTEIVTRTAMTHHLKAFAGEARRQSMHWLREDREAAIAAVAIVHTSLATLAHNSALVAALEMLVLRTSLILGVYASTGTFEDLPGYYGELLARMEAGNGREAAAQVERCLSAVERGLIFVSPSRRDVDLTRLMQRVG